MLGNICSERKRQRTFIRSPRQQNTNCIGDSHSKLLEYGACSLFHVRVNAGLNEGIRGHKSS